MQMILNFFSPSILVTLTQYLPPSDCSATHFLLDANLLTLNSSKTEFLIIGLKQLLSKIDNSSLNTTHSARNLGFIFDEHLTFSDQISSLSKSCYSHIQQLRCIRPYLDSIKRPVPSLPLLSTLNLTTVTLSTTIFLNLKLPPPADSELSCTYCG